MLQLVDNCVKKCICLYITLYFDFITFYCTLLFNIGGSTLETGCSQLHSQFFLRKNIRSMLFSVRYSANFLEVMILFIFSGNPETETDES